MLQINEIFPNELSNEISSLGGTIDWSEISSYTKLKETIKFRIEMEGMSYKKPLVQSRNGGFFISLFESQGSNKSKIINLPNNFVPQPNAEVQLDIYAWVAGEDSEYTPPPSSRNPNPRTVKITKGNVRLRALPSGTTYNSELFKIF